MGTGTITNTNPIAWGLPLHGGRVHPDRVIVPIPRPFDVAPGMVPFHRYLQAQNQIEQVSDAARPIEQPRRACDCLELSGSDATGPGLLPKLGEVLPVGPQASAELRVQDLRQRVVPATGRLLDLFA